MKNYYSEISVDYTDYIDDEPAKCVHVDSYIVSAKTEQSGLKKVFEKTLVEFKKEYPDNCDINSIHIDIFYETTDDTRI